RQGRSASARGALRDLNDNRSPSGARKPPLGRGLTPNTVLRILGAASRELWKREAVVRWTESLARWECGEAPSSPSARKGHSMATETRATAALVAPPVAKKVPHVTELHGHKLVDNYFWMRDRKDPELMPHLQAENAHAESYMSDTEALQQIL